MGQDDSFFFQWSRSGFCSPTEAIGVNNNALKIILEHIREINFSYCFESTSEHNAN